MQTDTHKKKEEMKDVNPMQYFYPKDAKIELDGELLIYLMQFLGRVIENDTSFKYKDKYKFKNTKTNKIVKNPKKQDLETGTVVKVPDFESLLQSTPTVYRGEVALEGIHALNLLNEVHLQQIQQGKAQHFSANQPEVVNEKEVVKD